MRLKDPLQNHRANLQKALLGECVEELAFPFSRGNN